MRKILITDDDPMMLRMASFILKKSGHEVLTAYNGIETVAIAAAEQPDLLFLDIEMPDTDGLKTLKMLREQAETAEMPVCLMTGTVTDAIRRQAEALGVVDIICKPLQADALNSIAASI